jgi:RNA polymerase sigma factor (sigma-70 family)
MASQLDGVVQQIRRLASACDLTPLTDAELIESFVRQREEAAFETLVHRHGAMVLGVCRRVLGHAADAEDAFQATFLVFARKAASLRRRERLANWLYGVAFRTAQKARAAGTRRRTKERQVSAMSNPSSLEEPQDWLPVLDEELNLLPEKYRLPVVLCDLEGRSRSEVSRQLACPQGTISSRLARGRQMLAERLTRRGLALSAGALAATFTQAAEAAVPPALVNGTVCAAMSIATGDAAVAGLVSAKVSILTEGVLKAMWISKLKVATVVLLGLALVGGAVGTLTHLGAAEQAADSGTAPMEQSQEPAQEAAPTLQRAKRLMEKADTKGAAKIEGVPEADKKDDKARPQAFGQERLKQLLQQLLNGKKTDEQIVETLYLATLARTPSENEVKRCTDHVARQMAAKKQRAAAFEDILGALTSSAECEQHVAELFKDNVPQKFLEQFRKAVPLQPKGDPNAPGRGPFFNH